MSPEMEKSVDVPVKQPVQQVKYPCPPRGFASVPDEY